MSAQQLTVSTETIQSVVQQYFAASRGNNKVEEMVACFAEDSINFDPAEGVPLRGHEDLRQFFITIANLFETVGLQEEFISINGDRAAVKWIGHGIARSKVEVTFEGIDVFEFNTSGKIQSMRAYWNPAAMLAKLGVS